MPYILNVCKIIFNDYYPQIIHFNNSDTNGLNFDKDISTFPKKMISQDLTEKLLVVIEQREVFMVKNTT